LCYIPELPLHDEPFYKVCELAINWSVCEIRDTADILSPDSMHQKYSGARV